ncbi:MAG: 4'-phosphopantetheinyl transferase superfamily protein [Proteobacteria bacterium]|nr:4'-phosphopantetheinyl transferase superfamily protein [Pseudomonadota bacterium]
MKHAGNDIIDLSSPHTQGKSKDRRYVKRILTSEEQDVVYRSVKPDKILWAFWAAKETAYKAVSKLNPFVTSIPVRYNCSIDKTNSRKKLSGIVKTPVCDVAVAIYTHNDFVHCIGITGEANPDHEIIYGVHTLDCSAEPDFDRSSERESRYVREMAQKRLESHLSWKEDEISITQNRQANGIFYPEVFLNNLKTPVDLSLSHDGRFVAYAFYVNR